jgi:hypothetical protein
VTRAEIRARLRNFDDTKAVQRRAWSIMRRRAVPRRAPGGVCQHCGQSGPPLQRHHYDYHRPLAIEWLCSPCHSAADAARRLCERAGLPPAPLGVDLSPVLPLERISDPVVLEVFHLI